MKAPVSPSPLKSIFPTKRRNDSVAGFFAKHASSGQIYLFHSGRVGGGAKGSRRTRSWPGRIFKLIRYMPAMGRRRKVCSSCLSLRVAPPCSRSLRGGHRRFKAAVREGRTETTTAKEKEHQYRAYFDESFGRRKDGPRPRHRLRIQAWRSSEKPERMASTQRPCQESTNRQVRIARSWRIQGTELVEAYEVKTRPCAAIYTPASGS